MLPPARDVELSGILEDRGSPAPGAAAADETRSSPLASACAACRSCEDAYIRLLIRWPRAICVAVLLLVTACNSALYYSHRYELQNFGLYELIVASRAADRMDMVNDALRRRDLRAPDVRPRSELSNVVDSVRLYYRWADGRDADIFTSPNLAAMCEAENVVLGRPDYDAYCFDVGWSVPGTFSYSNATGRRCTQPFTSAVSFFYVDWAVLYPLRLKTPWFWNISPTLRLIVPPPPISEDILTQVGDVFNRGKHTRRCQRLGDVYVAARSKQLHELAATLSADDALGRLLRALVEGATANSVNGAPPRASRAVSAFPPASPIGDRNNTDDPQQARAARDQRSEHAARCERSVPRGAR